MRRVFVAQHPTEAHVVRGVLEAEGIQAEVRGESLFGARGEAPVTPDTLPSVWVLDEQDAARAVEVLADYGSSRPAEAGPGIPWTCAACGERIEPQFTECWRCGSSR